MLKPFQSHRLGQKRLVIEAVCMPPDRLESEVVVSRSIDANATVTFKSCGKLNLSILSELMPLPSQMPLSAPHWPTW